MHPEQAPPQSEARQPDDFPPPPQPPPGLGAGECGDAIWEDAAFEGGTVDASTPAPDGPGGPADRETGIRGGRFISLDDHYVRRDQVNG